MVFMKLKKFGVVRIVIILICCLFISGCHKNKRDDLILVTEAGFAPYEYYENGEIVGIDIDIAREIAKELGKNLIIKDVAFDSIINEVKTSKSDLGAAGISYTEERAREVDFTINYATNKQVVLVRRDSNITSFEDITGSISVQLGSLADTYITKNYPNISLVREKKFLSAIESLKNNKVSAVVMDYLPAQRLLTDDLVILDRELVVDNYGMVVSKGNTELLNACNKVIERLLSTGEMDEIILSHMELSPNKHQGTSLFDKFYNTVIYDGRYKYILEGLEKTLIMAIGSMVLGIVLGILMALIRDFHDNTSKLHLLNLIAKAYITIIRGTPSILQLMIIYYVIFKNVSVNIVLVGILAFGINSGAYVAEIIRAGFNSVLKGQKEAGYALGLSYFQIMHYIVFPQAIKNVLPALGNEFITLVKETSVGAYIGIVELTKASDIIASRTYDYFFPLILIALIYLIITYTLSRIVSLMEKRLYVRS